MLTKERKKPRPPIQIGERFGRWTVIGKHTYPSPNVPHVLCRCECGYETDVATRNLCAGLTKGCDGCRLRRTTTAPAFYTRVCSGCGEMSYLQTRPQSDRCLSCSKKGVCPPSTRKYVFTLQEMGNAFGVTREAVRLRIKRLGEEAVYAQYEQARKHSGT